MDDIDSQKIDLLLNFMVPGIVFLYARSKSLVGTMPSFKEGVPAYLVVTMVYLASQSVLIDFLIGHEILAEQTVDANTNPIFRVFSLFVVPFALGSFAEYSVRFEWLRPILNRLGVNPVHPVSTAWDWKLGDGQSHYVRILLKDGTILPGFWGPHSFASTDPNERDLYIEEAYHDPENGPWQALTYGFYVSKDKIKIIEFYPKSNGGIV